MRESPPPPLEGTFSKPGELRRNKIQHIRPDFPDNSNMVKVSRSSQYPLSVSYLCDFNKSFRDTYTRFPRVTKGFLPLKYIKKVLGHDQSICFRNKRTKDGKSTQIALTETKARCYLDYIASVRIEEIFYNPELSRKNSTSRKQ